MKKNSSQTKEVSFELVQGKLASTKKEKYDWAKEKQYGLEPWHLTTVALILDVCVLLMYLFVNILVAYQIPIGFCVIVVNTLLILASFYLLKKKGYSQGTRRFSKTINMMGIGDRKSVV